MSCPGHQVSQSAEVVSGSGEGEQPRNLVDPSQLHFLQRPYHLYPPERLLHSFSLPLAHLVSCVPRGPLIHHAPAVRIVLRHVRGDVHPTKFSYQFLLVVILLSPAKVTRFPPGIVSAISASFLLPHPTMLGRGFECPEEKPCTSAYVRVRVVTKAPCNSAARQICPGLS